MYQCWEKPPSKCSLLAREHSADVEALGEVLRLLAEDWEQLVVCGQYAGQ